MFKDEISSLLMVSSSVGIKYSQPSSSTSRRDHRSSSLLASDRQSSGENLSWSAKKRRTSEHGRPAEGPVKNARSKN
ncbi:hypothetical protein FOZ60_011004 [Perkinsus olseni]|uniref:Uncharacterized protein n=1 Tax=Perkinsus olseni TaxID=32597 RepID=A0A7J6NFC3_PEROL|nr:hypothetical protein FOZ60_011004 [Perkinsus olseni]